MSGRKSSRLYAVAPIFTCVAMVFAGCSSSDPDAGAAAPVGEAPAVEASAGAEDGGAGADAPEGAEDGGDPCALLTRQQVGKLLKRKVLAGERTDTGEGPQCVWGADGIPIENIGVGFSNRFSNEAELEDAAKETARGLESLGGSKKATVERVSGVGEAAYIVDDLMLLFVADGRSYTITGLTNRSAIIRTAKAVAS